MKSFRLYKEKLDKEADIFFTKPRSGKGFKKDDLTWFTKRPLGLNTLLSKMKSISLRLKLSKIYTNHCCRATAVTLLSSNGIEARKIMEVTGHKSESSLRSYDRNTSDSTKRKISNILSNTSLPKASVVNQTLSSTVTSTATSNTSQYFNITDAPKNVPFQFNFNNCTVNQHFHQ